MTLTQVEFYKQHGITTDRHVTEDRGGHFARREALYRQLGILPMFIKGKRVLEIGPGSGSNSLYTASLGPSKYTLVEGNPTAVEDIVSLFSGYPDLWQKVQMVPLLLSDFVSRQKYDFVFCEGFLPDEPEPEKTIKQLAGFVAPGGLLVVTCIDPVSYFPDSLRRLFAQLLIDPADALEDQLAALRPVFGRHLSRLQGMSRQHDAWIMDNLINPASNGDLFAIPEAISTIEDKFDFHSSSPRFTTDWRWYKSALGDEQTLNRLALDQYWQCVHNFLDHSRVLPPRAEDLNRSLFNLCSSARSLMGLFEDSKDPAYLSQIRDLLTQIISQVQGFSPRVAEAITEAHSLLGRDPLDGEALAQSIKFGSLFGRNQQYLTLYRRT